MPERFEPKFTPAEIDKKHEEALEMDKEAEEMVVKGEAETPQEAIEKMEEKELEKSPEEMLKEALPLAWEEALEFAKEKGFNSTEEIKRRIDLAKKYNLEPEHFFYDPEKLERETPTREQIEKTAKELEYVREFAEEFSKQSEKPVFCILNARNGTIYSYGVDTLNIQLNLQFKDLARKENRSIQELRDEFARDLKGNEHWRRDKKLSIMEVTGKWMDTSRLSHFLGQTINTKISSGGGGHKIPYGISSLVYRNNVLFIDAHVPDMPGDPKPYRPPDSFAASLKRLFYYGKRQDFDFEELLHRNNIKDEVDESLVLKKFIDDKVTQQGKKVAILLDPGTDVSVWWDNFPQILGKRGKKFAHEPPLYPTERVTQSAQRVEYLSEKVKNALRYYQRDAEGRNWFERNFEGIMLGKKEAPEKGSREYLAMFRKWVPYETDEKGEAKIDDKGYPIPRKTAPMTVAAEDELARLEVAMEELGG